MLVRPSSSIPADASLSLSGSVEIKLGKNRTEAEVKRYTEEKERLERKKEEIRGHLARLRGEKRELKETLLRCTGKGSGGGPGRNLGPRHMGFEREGPGFVNLPSGSFDLSPLTPLVQTSGQCQQHQQVVRLFPG